MQDVHSLLVRIRAGDDQAIKEVYLSCRQQFCQVMAYKWRLSSEDAIELYQESFLALLESIQRDKILEIRQGWLPLLKGIGRNLQLVKRRNVLPVESTDALPELLTDDETELDEAYLQLIERELNSLDDKCRGLIGLRVLKGMHYQAIYTALNPNPITNDEKALQGALASIRVQVSRCIDRLREKVERVKNTGL